MKRIHNGTAPWVGQHVTCPCCRTIWEIEHNRDVRRRWLLWRCAWCDECQCHVPLRTGITRYWEQSTI